MASSLCLYGALRKFQQRIRANTPHNPRNTPTMPPLAGYQNSCARVASLGSRLNPAHPPEAPARRPTSTSTPQNHTEDSLRKVSLSFQARIHADPLGYAMRQFYHTSRSAMPRQVYNPGSYDGSSARVLAFCRPRLESPPRSMTSRCWHSIPLSKCDGKQCPTFFPQRRVSKSVFP